MMTPIVKQISQEYKKALQEIFGNELAELVLFGSYARGEQKKDSDVDFAVIFHDHHKATIEDKQTISNLSSRLSLKYGLMLSSLTTNLDKKQKSILGVYQEIRKEGIKIT